MASVSSFIRARLAVVLFALVLTVTPACSPQPINVNVIQGISLAPGQTLALDTPLTFILNGVGKCNSINIDWGDGDTDPAYYYGTGGIPIDLSGTDPYAISTRTLTHMFTGWGGGKTMTVEGNNGCIGKVNVRFNVSPLEKQIGWGQPGPAGTNMCQTSGSGVPNMIPRMLVHVSATLVVGNARGIDFGCFAGGCVGDADGRPGPVADSRFPFPGMREYSVVYRIGSQLIQGGVNTQFTTTASGPLEFCLNDGDMNLANNKGGLLVKISVDQLGP